MSKAYDNYVRSYCLSEARDGGFFDLMRDLYYSDEVQGLKIYPQHSTINRLDHITSVTYTSYCWAKKRGLDVRATVRGALPVIGRTGMPHFSIILQCHPGNTLWRCISVYHNDRLKTRSRPCIIFAVPVISTC